MDQESWEAGFHQHLDMGGVQDFHDQDYCHTMMNFDEEDKELLRNFTHQTGLHSSDLDPLWSETVLSAQRETETNGITSGDQVMMPPRACVLSFDNYNVIPIISKQEDSNKKRFSSKRISRASHKAEPSAKKKRRSSETVMDHVTAERIRRRQITEGFAALSATIPGLKKLDKMTILEEAIKYVKQLQERVTKLEKVTPVISIKKIEVGENDDFREADEVLPKIEVRVTDNQVLLGIHCVKQKGIQFKILSLLQNFNLCVTSSSVLPFGNSILGITIIAQMGDAHRIPVNDVVKNLRQILLKSHEVDP
ncbi:transcription factor NAI1-like [Neltuma alba]|nr:transcription factor NAI1-like [Prosopis alba]